MTKVRPEYFVMENLRVNHAVSLGHEYSGKMIFVASVANKKNRPKEVKNVKSHILAL